MLLLNVQLYLTVGSNLVCPDSALLWWQSCSVILHVTKGFMSLHVTKVHVSS